MTEPDQRPSSGRPWWLWGGLLALAVTLAAMWSRGAPTDPGPVAVQTAPADDVDGGEASGPIARVQGQVFVEVPRPPPMPAVELVPDPDMGTTGDGPDTDSEAEDEADGRANDEETEGFGVDADEPELGPPPVDLRPPPAGECFVIAWQQGVQVSEPTPCAADGRFEVALHPGRHGRTAFEILVPDHLRAVLEVDVPEGEVGRLPPVALGQAQRVEGLVVDGRGEPLAGVVVQARPRPDLDEPEPWRATSAADGSFRFDTLPPGPVTLRAEAPGFAPSVVEALAPQAELLVTLQALVDLRGRVVGPPEALARTRVRIEGSAIWPVREQAIEADGSFVLTQVPDGIYAVEAVVEAIEPGQDELASIPLENVTPELSLTLALVPAFRVPVRVLDPRGGPVAGARVVLSNASVGLLPRMALTDAQGTVAIGPMVPGPYVVRAHAEGFLPSVAVALTVEGADAEPQVLTLGRPGSIAGIVVDEHGEPVADARVELVAEHLFTAGEGLARARFGRAALQSAGSLGVTTGPVPEVPYDTEADAAALGSSIRTDADGRFVFALLTPGQYALEASHGHYAASAQALVRLGAGKEHEGLRLVLRTGHRLTGRVLDGNDRPVEGALVRFDDGARAYSDARGVFDGGIRRGAQRLEVSASGLAPRTVEVTVRDEPVDVEVVLGRARAQIDGRIEGGNGEALANARITLRTVDGLSATRIEWTDEYGRYRFDDLPPGVVELDVDHPEYGPATQRVVLEGEDARERVDVALVEGWTIEVEVVAEGTRDPIGGVTIEGGGRRASTDEQGRAVLEHLLDERVQVEARAEGYGAQRQWVAREGADRRSCRIALTDGGGLSGRVIDYRGDAIAGVEVIALAPGGAELGRARTNTRGEFQLDDVPAGDVELTVAPPADREEELAPAAQSTDVIRGHVTREVTLRLDRR